MNALKTLLTSVIATLSISAWGGIEELPLPALLDTLDRYLAETAEYETVSRNRMTQLKRELKDRGSTNWYESYRRLGEGYSTLNVDTALQYYELGLSYAVMHGNPEEAQIFRLRRIDLYPRKGLLHTAISELDSIDPATLTPSAKQEYFETKGRVYGYAYDIHTPDSIRAAFEAKAAEMNDSLMKYVPAKSLKGRMLLFMDNLTDGKNVTAMTDSLRALAQEVGTASMMYAPINKVLADYELKQGNTDEAMRHLAAAAIGDIVSGNYEAPSLHRLGKMLFERGDEDRAYAYITGALQRSVASGSRIHMQHSAEALPMLFQKDKQQISKNRALMMLAIAIALVVCAVLISQHLRMRRYRRHISSLLKKITEHDQKKDIYISELLGMFLSNMEETEHMTNKVIRKLRASQYSSLLSEMEEGQHMHKQLQRFYHVFAPSFARVFPNFLNEVNELLHPDRQLTGGEDGSMTPEMRILALMRLGINDSQQMSRFLGLSLNTVYTYRTRLKNRAVNREDFERKVREIG